MAKRKRAISALHALNSEELDFCRIFLGFGETQHTEAYRRAFFSGAEEQIENEDGEKVTIDTTPPPKEVSRLASRLLKQEYIQAALGEMKRSGGDVARDVLVDQAKFGDETSRRRAAEQILAQEDKHRFRDAVEQFWAITAEAGAEIVIPLPEKCPHCGGQIEVSAKVEELWNRESSE